MNSPEESYFFRGMTYNFGDVFQSFVSHCLDIEGWIEWRVRACE